MIMYGGNPKKSKRKGKLSKNELTAPKGARTSEITKSFLKLQNDRQFITRINREPCLQDWTAMLSSY